MKPRTKKICKRLIKQRFPGVRVVWIGNAIMIDNVDPGFQPYGVMDVGVVVHDFKQLVRTYFGSTFHFVL